MRGLLLPITFYHCKLGSPPRMRGLLHGCSLGGWELGITPAHAGLTVYKLLRKSLKRDHPRACGAYSPFCASSSNFVGSPPRMRGLLARGFSPCLPLGITPAHAGLTSAYLTYEIPARDHPRACGAYAELKKPEDDFSGSPPRMRGLHNP